MKLLAATLLALAILAAPAHAAPALVKVGDFAAPTYLTSPPGDPSHLYVTEKAGTVRLITGGVVQPAPFLDISADVLSDSEERGLLSIAFAPDYATSGVFYVYLTRRPDGALEVRQYRRSASPAVADPASKVVLVTIPHSEAANHNGGQLQFGPDGKLYAGTGDGGGGNDQFHHSEDPNSLLGKLLRFEAGGPVVVARGLRNPWRFSFDRLTGQLVIGDVGQDQYEEVDVGFADDYGWPCFEGEHATGSSVASCAGGTLPVFERAHSTGACSITGGYVVRDPGLPTLAGRYLYGDYCSADIRSIDLTGNGDASTGLSVTALSSFGEDACGQLYTVSLNGPVSEIVDGAPSNCAGSPAPVAVTPPACTFTLKVTGLHSVGRRHRLSAAVKANGVCPATVSAKIRGVAQFKAVKVTVRVPRQVVSLRLSKHGLSAVRRALRRHHSLRVTVRVGTVTKEYHVKS